MGKRLRKNIQKLKDSDVFKILAHVCLMEEDTRKRFFLFKIDTEDDRAFFQKIISESTGMLYFEVDAVVNFLHEELDGGHSFDILFEIGNGCGMEDECYVIKYCASNMKEIAPILLSDNCMSAKDVAYYMKDTERAKKGKQMVTESMKELKDRVQKAIDILK